MKRNVIIFVLVCLFAGLLPQNSFAAGIPDMEIIDVYASKPAFSAGVRINILVETKNSCTAPWSSGTMRVDNMVNCVFGTNETYRTEGTNSVCETGDEVTWLFPRLTATSNEITFRIDMDATNITADSNKSNHIKTVTIVSTLGKLDLEIEDLEVSNPGYSIGDELLLYANVKNNGTVPIEYSSIDVSYNVNGKKYNRNIVFSIMPHESKKIEVGKFVATKEELDISAAINIKGKIDEVNYRNNEFSKNFSAVVQEEYVWDNTNYKTGGYVPAVEADSVSQVMYARTDMGEFYKYDYTFDQWEPFLTHLKKTESIVKTDGFAFNDGNEDVLFVSHGSGSYRGFKENYGILRTKDGGKTWKEIHPPVNITAGNSYHRHSTIMLDPNNINILYGVSPSDGAYYTENALDNTPVWKTVDLPGFVPSDDAVENPLSAVLFDDAKIINGRSARIYIASYKNGIYMSEDGGKTFNLQPNSPKKVYKMVINKAGRIYAASVDENSGGVYLCENGVWKNISPIENEVYYSVACSDINPEYIAVSTYSNIYFSLDGGKTWDMGLFANINFKKHNFLTGPSRWYITGLSFDSKKAGGLWFSDMGGVYKIEDITAPNKEIRIVGEGLEELAIKEIACAPERDGYYITHQDGGFGAADTPFEYPTETRPVIKNGNNIIAVDYCRTNPDFVAVGGTQEWWETGKPNGAYSTDGGRTMTDFPTMPTGINGESIGIGNIAVSAGVGESGNPTIIVSKMYNKPHRTTDLGVTWEEIDAPFGAYCFDGVVQLCSDKIKNGTFYYYDLKSGVFYKSINDGISFDLMTTLPIAEGNTVLRSFCEKEDYLAIALGAGGLHISTDGGKSFKQSKNVQKAWKLGTGKSAEGKDYDTIFVYGVVDYREGIFRSTDLGESWTMISNDEYVGRTVGSMDGDKNRFGVVYTGTAGFGVWCGMPVEADFRPIKIEIDSNALATRDKNFVLSGVCNKQTTIHVELNGEKYEIDNRSADGVFSKEFNLIPGENKFTISAGETQKHYVLTYDPAYLEVKTDIEYVKVSSETFNIQGSVNYINRTKSIEINNEKVQVNESDKTFTKTIDLMPGINNINIVLFDDDGHSVEKTVMVERDVMPPEVVFDVPDGYEVTSVPFVLKGTINEDAKVSVNGGTNVFYEKGEFKTAVSLNSGNNIISFECEDQSGNKKAYKINIFYITYDGYKDSQNMVDVFYGTPVIDGVIDEESWKIDRILMKRYDGNTDNCGTFGLLSDGTNLYLGVKMYDNFVNVHTEPQSRLHTFDSVEICIDAGGERSALYDENDRQIRLDTFGSIYDCKSGNYIEGAESVVTHLSDGYVIEARIPLSALSINYGVGKGFNIDVSVNDCDTEEAARNGIVGWCADASNYNNTRLFGSAIFVK